MFYSSYSNLFYELSHPNKYGVPQLDLSKDSEAKVEDSLLQQITSNQVPVERVIVKIFTKYRCDVVITDRLWTLFTSKLWRMGKSLQRFGGTGRRNLVEKWKKIEWTVELQAAEIVSRKRKPDNVIATASKDKCAKFEEDLKQCNKKLKDLMNEISCLKKSNKALSSALKSKGSMNTPPSRKKTSRSS